MAEELGREGREAAEGACPRRSLGGVLSLVPRGSPGCRAEQAAELAAQGAMGLASFPEGRPGRRNVGSWQRGRPTPQPGALCCRRAAGAGQGAHGRSLSGSPRGCGRGIDTTGCASTLEQRPETDVGARGGTPGKKSLGRPLDLSELPASPGGQQKRWARCGGGQERKEKPRAMGSGHLCHPGGPESQRPGSWWPPA